MHEYYQHAEDYLGNHTESLWPRTTEGYSRLLTDARDLMKARGLDVVFDEIALLVPDYHTEYHLIESAVRHGYSLTNASVDEVKCGPLDSEYTVHYSFLFNNEFPFRLEVMRMLGGHSPLHLAQWNAASNEAEKAGMQIYPVPVHLSFKVADEGEYLTTMAALGSMGDDLTLAQTCRSDYGIFSYWKARTELRETLAPGGVLPIYIKPRANMRDSVQS